MPERDPQIARHATATSDASLDRALRDQATLRRGRLNATDDDNRYTPSGLSREHYDALRTDRDDLDYREWMASTQFSGLVRPPTTPGMAGQADGSKTEAERRRDKLRRDLDEGF